MKSLGSKITIDISQQQQPHKIIKNRYLDGSVAFREQKFQGKRALYDGAFRRRDLKLLGKSNPGVGETSATLTEGQKLHLRKKVEASVEVTKSTE